MHMQPVAVSGFAQAVHVGEAGWVDAVGLTVCGCRTSCRTAVEECCVSGVSRFRDCSGEVIDLGEAAGGADTTVPRAQRKVVPTVQRWRVHGPGDGEHTCEHDVPGVAIRVFPAPAM